MNFNVRIYPFFKAISFCYLKKLNSNLNNKITLNYF